MTAKRASAVSAAERHASVGDVAVSSVLGRGAVVYDPEDPDRKWDADEETLAALGYKPEFRREFNLFTTFSVSFAVLGLLPSFATTLYYGMAPPGWGPLAAWITGWSNWLGQITAAPSVNYGTASMTLAAASIGNPNYVPENWHVYLLTAFIMLLHAFISSMPTRFLARFNAIGSTFNMLALIVVIILIPASTNRESQGLPRFAPSSQVWGNFYDGTNWPNGIAVLMSFLSIIWTLSGYDSPFHISEECSNANVAAPRAIVLTSSIGGSFGWFLQLVVAYTVVDISSALESDLGQPWAAYLIQVVSKRITLAILAMTIMAGFSMGQACMIAASRVTFAYARDGCFPFSDVWKKVNKYTRTPVNAVIANCVVGLLLLLLIFGGPLAAGALFSIGAISQYTAFIIPIFIRLFFVGNRFRPGPWNLGRFTLPIGGTGCAFVTLMLPIMCFPAYRRSDLNAQEMNWTCLVYGAPMSATLIWWVLSARKWFKGPKVNLEHMMYGRETQGIDQINGIERQESENSHNTGSTKKAVDADSS
ncbi:MAG: hypothetical protein Q9162_002839 [Coniocarpon cinnabarinum]